MSRLHVSNRILSGVGSELRDLVLRRCELVQLSAGTVMAETGDMIGKVHFIESGFLSVIASRSANDQVEVGLIGREGMGGISVALGCPDAPFRVIVQAAGMAYEMSSAAFHQVSRDVPDLLRGALAFSQAFTRQVADTGRANARSTVESRLARWLLMAHDRLDDDDMYITHETLSLMLGVRRPGVTVSLHVLEGEHMIKSTRGRIRILDRAKLVAAAKGSYGVPQARFTTADAPLHETVAA